MVYRYCIVPNCKNTTVTTRDKSFINVPLNPKQRKLWLRAVRRDPQDLSAKSHLHVCEDHFNLEEDMENYMEWKQMGVQKRMKKHVVPHKFACQPDRIQTVKSSTSNVLLKKAKLELLQDALRNTPSTSKDDLQASDTLLMHEAEPTVMDQQEQTEESLIEMVKANPILYDPDHPDYKNVTKTEETWTDIGLSFKKDGETMKKKWKNIRDAYVKHLKTKAAFGEKSKSSFGHWQWANEMEHFLPFLSFKTESTTANPSETNDPESHSNSETVWMEDFGDELAKQSLDNDDSNFFVENRQSDDTPEPSTQNIKEFKKQVTKDGGRISSVDKVLDFLQNKWTRTDHDAIDLIFMGYAKTVKTFSPRRQAITNFKIAEIIMQQKLEELKDNGET